MKTSKDSVLPEKTLIVRGWVLVRKRRIVQSGKGLGRNQKKPGQMV
ncbi:hypothetical protein [Undibacterium squillarum]